MIQLGARPVSVFTRLLNASLFQSREHIYHISVETEPVSFIMTDFFLQEWAHHHHHRSCSDFSDTCTQTHAEENVGHANLLLAIEFKQWSTVFSLIHCVVIGYFDE